MSNVAEGGQQNLPANAAWGAVEGEQEMEGEGYEGEGEQEDEIDWEQVRQRITQDPNYANQFLQEIQHSNPELYQTIQQNPQGMLEMLMSGGQPSQEQSHGALQVTEEEKAAIDRVYSK